MIEKKVFKGFTEDIEYVIDYPDDFDATKRYPLLFYIHGYGFVRKGLDCLIELCPVRREYFPEGCDFIKVVPSCTRDTWLEIFESLVAFLKEVISLPYVNDKKVYLTGTSMGGYTSWLLLYTHAKLFAAAVVCCGGGHYYAADTKAFNSLPIRAIHGRLDQTVLCRESEIMAERINRYGGQVELIIHEDLDHNVWSVTFSNPETYRWLNGFEKNDLD